MLYQVQYGECENAFPLPNYLLLVEPSYVQLDFPRCLPYYFLIYKH